jgi:ABC-type arginine/histidine transport system permease subunit
LGEDKKEDLENISTGNVIRLIDNFIEQMQETRKTLTLTLSLSISSIVISPVAIGLSIFLLQHPSFFAVLEREYEFGLVLTGLLVGVIIVSSIWFVVGIKQYRSINSWNKKYSIYSKKKEELDRNISSEYGLDQD